MSQDTSTQPSQFTNTPVRSPQWPIPKHIRAYTTLRYPGHSVNHYRDYNLASHVGDQEEKVQHNRNDLKKYAQLPNEPIWLNQTHSTIAVNLDTITPNQTILITADASHTRQVNKICVVMTADCLPILVTNRQGTEVAAIHAGWQGLSKGIIENTLSALKSPASDLLLWLGPSIQAPHYDVREDVYQAFAHYHSTLEMQAAFTQKTPGTWKANIPLLALQRLIRYGVQKSAIYCSQECTYTNANEFFSFRRDGITGRMASLIFIARE